MMVNNWALSIQLNVRFEFSATSSSEWNCCSIFQNFQKEANLARYTQIFRNFSPKFFFPFIFASGISRIFGRMVRISDIQQIPESFLGNFCTIFLCFQILESFSSMESVASPQTSFGVRFSRIHFSPVGEKWMRDKRTPKDVCGEAMVSAQSFHFFSRRLHVHPSSQSGNTLLIITRLLCSARLNLQFSDNYLVGQGIRESIPRCDQFCFFWRTECCSCLHTVANRFFNAVCSTKVKWKEVNIVLCLLDVKTK